MEDQPIPEEPLIDTMAASDELSWSSMWQVAVGDSNKTAESTTMEGLSNWESQMKTELNRRSYLRRLREEVSSTVNAYAVVLVLLASVTFVLYLQPPGGLNSDGTLNIISNGQKRLLDDTSAFIIFASLSFHLAVTGILVCLSCIAFVIPSESAYPEGMFTGEIDLRDHAVNLNETEKKQLHSKLLKTNNRVSLALRVARILAIVTNIFFVTSVWSSVYVAEASLYIVVPTNEDLSKKLSNSVLIAVAFSSFIFSIMFCLYSLALLWSIFNPATDAIVDTVIAISCFICRMVRSMYVFSKEAIDTLKVMDRSKIMNTICTKTAKAARSVANRLVSWIKWTGKHPRPCVRWSLRITLIVVIIVFRNSIWFFIENYIFFKNFYLFDQ